jgi:lipopolysaccharide export system ATP-binding protein
VTAILEGRGLVRRYGAVVAVAGIDLVVEPGEVVGLLGPNGAGKSTAFRLLVGLDRPDAGRISLGGEDVTRWPLNRRARAGMGYLPQHPSVLPRLSCRQNLELALRARGDDAAGVTTWLEQAGLSALADQAAGTLSGGERRRLEVARCLATRPRVVLMDEPFAGVDPVHVAAIRHTIRSLADEGIGVLLTDHAVREALPSCDRVHLLKDGVVRLAGTPDDVAQSEWARAEYLGHDFCR